MDETTFAGFLDELEKIGAVPGLGGKLLGHGTALAGQAYRGAGHLWGAARKGSEAVAQHLEGTGSRLGRFGAAGARVAPYAGAVWLGNKALNTTPVQSIRSRMSGQSQQQMYYPGGY